MAKLTEKQRREIVGYLESGQDIPIERGRRRRGVESSLLERNGIVKTTLALFLGVCILIAGCGKSSTTVDEQTDANDARPGVVEGGTSADSEKEAQEEGRAGVAGTSFSGASEKMIGDWVLDVSAMRQEGGFKDCYKAQFMAEETFAAEWKYWHITADTIMTGPQTERFHVRYEVVASQVGAATLRVTDSQVRLFPSDCKVRATFVAPGKLKLEPPPVLRLVNFLILKEL